MTSIKSAIRWCPTDHPKTIFGCVPVDHVSIGKKRGWEVCVFRATAPWNGKSEWIWAVGLKGSHAPHCTGFAVSEAEAKALAETSWRRYTGF